MWWNISLPLSVVWSFMLCFAPVCPFTPKYNCRHERHTQSHERPSGIKKLCDPSLRNHAAAAITQKCGSGFYRERSGPHRGQCVPCSCNGLSNECDELTGNCVNCQFNTAGDRCDRCKEGYHGNAASRTCHACPCPFTWSNFALACLDVGSGVVECLCKHGYAGARCDRCEFGYYGNPNIHGGSCRPCNCNNGSLNTCDSLTGECIATGSSSSSCDQQFHDCDCCNDAVLVSLEKVDDGTTRLKQQWQNISHVPGSLLRMSHLEANVSETKFLAGRQRKAEGHLDPEVERLELDANVVKVDLSQLTDETFKMFSYLEKSSQRVNSSELEAEYLLLEAEALLTVIRGLMNHLSEEKDKHSISLSAKDKVKMMEEARRLLEEVRQRGCIAQRRRAARQQQEAHKLLNSINVTVNMPMLSQTAAALMASDSSLRQLANLLSDAKDAVDATHDLNLRSGSTMEHLQRLQTLLETEQRTLHPEKSADLLKNVKDTFLMLENIEREFANHAAQIDGAKLKLFKNLNNIHVMTVENVVRKAEEHSEELNRLAAEMQQVLHNGIDSRDVLEAYNSMVNVIKDAEMAANESSMAAGQTLKDEGEGGLVNRAKELKDDSAHLWTEANVTHNDLIMLSHNAQKGGMSKQMDKGGSLHTDVSKVSDDLRKIERDDTGVLMESVKVAAFTSNYTVSNVTERLRNIRQGLERISLTNISVNVEDTFKDADQAVKRLNAALPLLRGNLTRVTALSRRSQPSVNMADGIGRIKDVIEETRNFVKRLSLATTFNGKGHIELHPPRNLEDMKAFTAVDLLLNLHQQNPSKADARRQRRQRKRRDTSLFVLYLGNKDASGDYIGMAVRRNVLICVYKLGGVVHEVETSRIATTTDVKSSNFDRVIFHRVYQDAEVNITQNFTSHKPVSRPPKRNLPDSVGGVLRLDPRSIVFFVGGYPEDFNPPVELRYPKFRGAIKLSYINDNPVCLFNFKRAAHMTARQPPVAVPRSGMSDYYEGTGYRMAFVKGPDKEKGRLFRFHTNSRETNALLFYIGDKESFFCVLVERGFLLLRGRQSGRELGARSADRVSLLDENFAVADADRFVVRLGQQQISTSHVRTNYTSYYIGGLPAELRRRDNISAPPLRGCVDQLTADDAEAAEYAAAVGVSDGCPAPPLLGVRAAALRSALTVDSQRVSLGFRSAGRHGAILGGGSQGPAAARALQLSLTDGYVVFSGGNKTLRSDKRYSDGRWHYLSAARRSTGWELSIDGANATQGPSPASESPAGHSLQEGKSKVCIANLYTRSEPSFIPADLSSFSQMGDEVPDPCSFSHPPQTGLLPEPVLKRPQKLTPIREAAESWCGSQQAHRGGYQLSEAHSWLRHDLPQRELNYRPHFSLDVRTRSPRGLLLHVAGGGVIPLLAVYVANGKIKMSLGQNRIIYHKQKSNDGNWHRVELSVEQSTFHLLVDGFRVTDGRLPNDEGSSLDFRSHVYLGADPLSKTTKGHDVPISSISGCVRNFKMNDVAVGKPEASHKALPCFDGFTEKGMYFGGGHIILENDFTIGSHFELAFELRPQHLSGLLFHGRGQETSFDMFLTKNKVGVVVDDGGGAVSVSVRPQSLCDGKFHVVTVSKRQEVLTLKVDSMSDQRMGNTSTPPPSTTLDELYIGGSTKQNGLPVSSPFLGCLRNVKVNGKIVQSGAESRVVGHVISSCPAD